MGRRFRLASIFFVRRRLDSLAVRSHSPVAGLVEPSLIFVPMLLNVFLLVFRWGASVCGREGWVLCFLFYSPSGPPKMVSRVPPLASRRLRWLDGDESQPSRLVKSPLPKAK